MSGRGRTLIATVTAAVMASGCGAADQASAPTAKAERAPLLDWAGIALDEPPDCPPPTSVPSHPRVPTREEAEATLRAAFEGVECDADVVLAAALFLEAVAIGEEVEADDLHTTHPTLPACEDDHLPDNAPTTAEGAETEARVADADTADACDASRGGTLRLCRGRHMNCVVVGEYTGPPHSE